MLLANIHGAVSGAWRLFHAMDKWSDASDPKRGHDPRRWGLMPTGRPVESEYGRAPWMTPSPIRNTETERFATHYLGGSEFFIKRSRLTVGLRAP